MTKQVTTTSNLKAAEMSQLFGQLDKGEANFQQVIAFIDNHFNYTPRPFVNGEVHNLAGENEGSCKVFGLAQLLKLDKLATLKLFAENYAAVKADPKGTNHPNIRNFSFFGWQGFLMPKNCLSPK